MRTREEIHSYIILAFVLVVISLSMFLFNDAQNFENEMTVQVVKEIAPVFSEPFVVNKFTNNVAKNYLGNSSVAQNLMLFDSAGNISDEDAFLALQHSKDILDQLGREGFNALYVRDLYFDSKKAYEGENITKILEEINKIQNETQKKYAFTLYFGAKKALNGTEKVGENYALVMQNLQIIEAYQQETYKIADAIKLLEYKVSTLNSKVYNFSYVFEQFVDIKSRFANEQFDGLFMLINSTYPKIDQIMIEQSRFRALYKASKRTISNYVQTYYKTVIFILVILCLAGAIVFNEFGINRLSRLIAERDVERKLIIGLIKRAQEEHFIKAKIGKSMYGVKINQYRSRSLKLNSEIPVLKSRLQSKISYRRYYSREKNA